MKNALAFSACLLCCGICFAQLSQEEAVKRLRDRQAAHPAPSEKLVSIKQAEFDDLQAELARLRERVAALDDLKVQVTRLRQAAAALQQENLRHDAGREVQASALAETLKAYAPTLVNAIKRQSENAIGGLGESAAKDKSTDEFSIISTDVRKTQSLVDPVVGVLKIKSFHWTVPADTPQFAGGFTFIITIQIAPTTDGKWKCVHAECKEESATIAGTESLSSGKTTDWTDNITTLIAEHASPE